MKRNYLSIFWCQLAARLLDHGRGWKVTVWALYPATCCWTGCGKSTSGLASHSDYSYAADTPDQVAQARARFDSAIQFFESAGFRATSLDRSDKRSEAILKAAGTEAQLTLLFPDNGFATITLSYKFDGTEAKAKVEAESMLARAQGILTPDKPSPPAK